MTIKVPGVRMLEYWRKFSAGRTPRIVATPEPWIASTRKAGLPITLTYPSTTLGRVLDQTADRFGSATAMIYGEQKWTYHELLTQVNRMAGGLAGLGVHRGERVLLT